MDEASLRTKIKIDKSESHIHLSDKIITIGSCFSDVIGQKLLDHKFQCLANPFGTVYNPISIAKLLTEKSFRVDHFAEVNELFFHYDLHSAFFDENKSELENRINSLKQEVIDYMTEANWLIITLGTSFVYTLKSSDEIVANCHKVPQNNFSKRLLSLEEIVDGLDQCLINLGQRNKNLRILFTVSPVRHIKDGIEENSLSKAQLRLACHELSKKHGNTFYFPSFEIMNDDLRDYRYFKADLIHPNEVAEEYIWEQFQSVYFDEDTRSFISDWLRIRRALNHRPFNLRSQAHQKFLLNTLSDLEKFADRVDTSEEIQLIKSQLI